MRILHVVGSFNNGGIENLLINLTHQQILQGLEVGIMIVTDFYSDSMISSLNSKVRVLYVQKPVGSHNPYYLLKLNWIYHRFAPDVLHLHSPYTIPYFKKLWRKEKKFVHIHNNVDIYDYDSSVNRYLAISRCVFDVYQKHLNNDKCSICYNGVNFKALIEKTYYSERPVKIVQVGRLLLEVKGQDITLYAVERLICQGYNLKVEFWGTGKDLMKLRSLVTEKGLDSIVKVVGDVDNKYVNSHLQDFDIAVFSSRHEGLGVAAIEAMGVGVPVLLSDVDGHKEVSCDGIYANMFQPDSVDGLSQKLIDVVNHYEKAVKLAIEAKQYVLSNFSIEHMADQLFEIYKKY